MRTKRQQLVTEAAKKRMWAGRSHKFKRGSLTPTAQKFNLTQEEITRTQENTLSIGGVDSDFDEIA